MAETPLAYASEDERHYSPTPAYPRDGRRAGAVHEEAGSPQRRRLEDENAGLHAALRASQAELAHLRSSPTSFRQSRGTPFSPTHHRPSSFDDPFASPSALAARRPLPSTEAYGAGEKTESGLSLEGTLESIRVQTEQLLEINDDFLAEQRRWSTRLGGSRSQRATPYRHSPMRASRQGFGREGGSSRGGEGWGDWPLAAS